MDSKVWGNKGWFFLHSITFNYPNQPTNVDKQNIKMFFHSMAKILPCSKCQTHFQQFIQQNPIESHYSDRLSLIKWLIDAHNNVNRILNKRVLSYEEAIQSIQNKHKRKSCVIPFLFTGIISITLYFMYKRLVQK